MGSLSPQAHVMILPPALTHPQPGDRPPAGFWSLWLLGGCTGLIILVLAAATVGVILNLREAALHGAETTLRHLSMVLAEQADRSLQALDLVLGGIVETLPARGVHDPDSYTSVMATDSVHLQLRDKTTGLPYVSAITLIGADGNLINFSRRWPVPKANVADRDYFRAMQADPKLEHFISAPVQNRGDGVWTVFLAHRVRAPDGRFIGLAIGAIELKYFADLYRSVATSPGDHLALLRQDGVLLVRYPPIEAIGQSVVNGGIRALHGGAAGVIRDRGTFDGVMRIKAAQRLGNFPLVMLTTETETAALGSWQRTAWVLAVIALFCCTSIAVAALAIGRWWRHQQTLGRERAERAETDRALALAEAALMRERERATALASSAKSEFLAAMSHEIRTPLNAVLGLAGVLLDGDLVEQQRKLVRTIHESGESLLLILNDILDFSKLDAGQMQFEATSFSPGTLTEGVASILFAQAATKGLELRTRLDPTLPAALAGDAGRVRQVLLNLTSNAVKFTEAGLVEISARVASRTTDDVTIEWTVRDTGIGIAPGRLRSLFAPFAQADSSITRRFGGSGLGLAICKRLVELMGGAIDMESTPGRGSLFRFHLTLPLAEAPTVIADPSDTSATLAALAAHIARLGRRLRILFAEDNPTNQFVALQLLKGLALQVDIAGNGLEAVAAASRVAYDVICMDMSMPEMDGLAATRAIRALTGPARNVPIIALTANAFPEDVRACLDAGMNLFVAKPVSKQALVAALLRALHRATEASPGAGTDVPDAACDEVGLTTLAQDIGMAGVIEVVNLFIAETRLRLRRIASEGEGPARLTHEVHTLKGAAGTVCAPYLAVLAAALDARLRTGGSMEPCDAEALTTAFDAYVVQVRDVILLEPAVA
jgi:signal transduction histidine kinase/CheY-like chemotaxis protein/HPt (histidine-containing phosphotransfer) domain-containing protein